MEEIGQVSKLLAVLQVDIDQIKDCNAGLRTNADSILKRLDEAETRISELEDEKASLRRTVDKNAKQCDELKAAVQDAANRDRRQNLRLVGLKEKMEAGKPAECSLRGRTVPDVLLIHCGGNDLGNIKGVELVTAMKQDLLSLSDNFSEMKIILSSINERCHWRKANPGKLNKARIVFFHNYLSSLLDCPPTCTCSPTEIFCNKSDNSRFFPLLSFQGTGSGGNSTGSIEDLFQNITSIEHFSLRASALTKSRSGFSFCFFLGGGVAEVDGSTSSRLLEPGWASSSSHAWTAAAAEVDPSEATAATGAGFSPSHESKRIGGSIDGLPPIASCMAENHGHVAAVASPWFVPVPVAGVLSS
ncbi:hypothetical protein F7725_022251 [Dissostichus mawsoni]|uniref:Uncharacterized protein n=1 Tax=Dissostichus mawsoni TaxID=36200 RepID=A0A7J5YXQ4_DISMA|nr:hypothetical protein F7725_022251 [Dissostichus mawsoni]